MALLASGSLGGSRVLLNGAVRDTLCTDGQDRTTQVTLSGVTQSLGYDPVGRMTTGFGKTFGYDSLNRHTTTTAGGVSTSFTYDPQGRRVKRTSNAPGDTTTTMAYVGSSDSPTFTLTGGPGTWVITDYVSSLEDFGPGVLEVLAPLVGW